MAQNPFYRTARKQDLSAIIDRHPTGFNDGVKMTLQEILSPDSSVGVIGYRVKQYNCFYDVRFMRDDGNEDYRFEVTVPSAQPFYHPSDKMSIAEKAHTFMLIWKSISTDRQSQHGTHFRRLEGACFNNDPNNESGKVTRAPTGVIVFPTGSIIVKHLGLSFSADDNWQDQPQEKLLRVEWKDVLSNFYIDCTKVFPEFIKSPLNAAPGIGLRTMTRDEAMEAVKKVKSAAKTYDAVLNHFLQRDGLGGRMEYCAEQSRVVSLPYVPTGP